MYLRVEKEDSHVLHLPIEKTRLTHTHTQAHRQEGSLSIHSTKYPSPPRAGSHTTHNASVNLSVCLSNTPACLPAICYCGDGQTDRQADLKPLCTRES